MLGKLNIYTYTHSLYICWKRNSTKHCLPKQAKLRTVFDLLSALFSLLLKLLVWEFRMDRSLIPDLPCFSWNKETISVLICWFQVRDDCRGLDSRCCTKSSSVLNCGNSNEAPPRAAQQIENESNNPIVRIMLQQRRICSISKSTTYLYLTKEQRCMMQQNEFGLLFIVS